MKLFYATALVAVFCAFAGLAAKTTTKTTAHKTATSGSTSKKAAVTTKTATKSAKGKTTVKTPPATWRTRQQAPTPDRYKEIQQALVDKGYLKGEPTGVWDADSTSAMQRFQEDQKLTPTGKINAPSLIGLGLGGKSAGAAEAGPIRQEAAPIKSDAPVPAAAPAPADPPPAQ